MISVVPVYADRRLYQGSQAILAILAIFFFGFVYMFYLDTFF